MSLIKGKIISSYMYDIINKLKHLEIRKDVEQWSDIKEGDIVLLDDATYDRRVVLLVTQVHRFANFSLIPDNFLEHLFGYNSKEELRFFYGEAFRSYPYLVFEFELLSKHEQGA